MLFKKYLTKFDFGQALHLSDQRIWKWKLGVNRLLWPAHPQFFVLVGVPGGEIWIIRLGGCLSSHETPPHVPQREA